jgi:hypothetical protein
MLQSRFPLLQLLLRFLLATSTGSTIAIATSAAAFLVGGEGLKKSKPFLAVVGLVTKGLDKASEMNSRKDC